MASNNGNVLCEDWMQFDDAVLDTKLVSVVIRRTFPLLRLSRMACGKTAPGAPAATAASGNQLVEKKATPNSQPQAANARGADGESDGTTSLHDL
jgi:hypothetical protein